MKKRYLVILLAASMVFASVSSVSAMYEFSDGTSAEISGQERMWITQRMTSRNYSLMI